MLPPPCISVTQDRQTQTQTFSRREASFFPPTINDVLNDYDSAANISDAQEAAAAEAAAAAKEEMPRQQQQSKAINSPSLTAVMRTQCPLKPKQPNARQVSRSGASSTHGLW